MTKSKDFGNEKCKIKAECRFYETPLNKMVDVVCCGNLAQPM